MINIIEIMTSFLLLINGDTGVFLNNGVPLPVLYSTQESVYVKTPCLKRLFIPKGKGILLQNVDVIVDAGHGGRNTGAVSRNGLVERDLNLKTAKKVKEKLDEKGLFTLLSRDHDNSARLSWRTDVIKALSPKVAISIHYNDSPNTKSSRIPGTQAFYQINNPESKRLGGVIFGELFPTLLKIGTDSGRWWSDKEVGALYRINRARRDLYGFLRDTQNIPSVLLEIGYIANPEEEKIFLDNNNLEKIAGRIADGIGKFINDKKESGVGFVEPTYPIRSGYGVVGHTLCSDPELDIK